MKASDFVSTSQERAENARNLLRTEETDAVNTGIVDTADKTVRGGTVLRKAAKGGVSNAALAAVTKGRSKDSGRRALRSRLKGGAKGAGKAALANGIHKQLEGTELEGADDLYYKGKAGVRLVRRVRGGSPPLRPDAPCPSTGARPLGRSAARRPLRAATLDRVLNSVEAKRRAQMTRYFKRNVYSAAKAKTATAASASVSKGAAASVGGGLKAAVAALGGTTLLALLGLIALILLVAALGGGAGGRETNTSRSNYSSLTIVENQVASFFLSQGLDELHTAAIMGNMYAESGINPSSTETGAPASASASGPSTGPAASEAMPPHRGRAGRTSPFSLTSSGTMTSGRRTGVAATESGSISSTVTQPSVRWSAVQRPPSWRLTTSRRPRSSSAMDGRDREPQG